MGVVVLIALVCLVLFLYRQYRIYQFWGKLSVPYKTPIPIFGNMLPTTIQTKALANIHKEIYDKYSDHRYVGLYMFSCPSLMIRDLELIKQVCIKDFNYFSDHRELLPKEADPFWNKLLFARKGRDWHDYRVIMSPAYSQTKTKVKYPFMSKCAQRLVESLPKGSETVAVDAYELFLKFSNDLTLNHAYGIEVNSFDESGSEFYRMAQISFLSAKMAAFKYFGAAISTTFSHMFKITFFKDETKEFYMKLMKDTVEYREKHNIVHVDVLYLLKEAQKGRVHVDNETKGVGLQGEDIGTNYVPPKITDEDILIQLLGLFLANFESFATFISNLAFELAVNPDVQERLIEEIDETWRQSNGIITYDYLVNMKYFEMVCNEGLRLRSPTNFLDRIVTKPYTIQPVLPHEKPLHLKVGQDITIPVYSISHDERYFEDPERFDPERFSDENKGKLIPETLLGLGYGSRFCIGARLVPFQTKLVLFHLLLKYRLLPTEKTVVPFELHKASFSQFSANGYWLGLNPRKDAPKL